MAEPPLTVIRNGDTVEAALPMPLPYLPVPTWLTTDLFGLVLIVPVFLVCSVIYRKSTGIKPPPRVRFIISPGNFRMECVNHTSGGVSSFECDPTKIQELRKNRYCKGLYVHVLGQTKQTFLEDIEDEVVTSIAFQVRDLLKNTLGLSWDDESAADPP